MDKRRSLADLTVHVSLAPPVIERTIHVDKDREIDFDEIVRPARAGRVALTMREALADYASQFVPVVAPDPILPVATQDAPAIPADEDMTSHG